MAKSKTKAVPVDKNALIVDQLIVLLESGVKPWARPWKSTKDSRDFQNLFTRKAYRGINPLLCQISNLTHGYESPFFLTFNQAKTNGWQVRKGAKAANIRFSKSGTNEVEAEGDGDGSETKTKGWYYQNWSAVFNLDCIDDSNSDIKIADIIGKPDALPDNTDTPVPAIDRFIAAIGADIEYGGDRAAYSPSADKIVLPHWKQFKSAAAGYATALHELAHWTGHQSRNCRAGITEFTGFGSKAYAREELVAEIAAAMLTSQLYPEYSGTEMEHHASYLDSWLSFLREEPSAFFTATSEAKKACELLITLGNRV